MRLRHPAAQRDQDGLHWKGKRNSYMLTTLPLPHAGSALRGDFSPKPPVPPVGRAHGWYLAPCLPNVVLSWSPYSGFSPQGLRGKLWGSTSRSLRPRSREGLPTTSAWVLEDGIPMITGQAVVPTSVYAHLQARSVAQSDRGIWQGSGLPNLGPQRRSSGLAACFAHALAEELSHSYPCCRARPPVPPDQKI